MFNLRCCLRRYPALSVHSRLAVHRTLVTSSPLRASPSTPPPPETATAENVLERVAYFLENGAAFVVPGYMQIRVPQKLPDHTVRRQTSEVVLDMLLRKRCYDEVLEFLKIMRSQNMRPPKVFHAKILALQFSRRRLKPWRFYSGLRKAFGIEEYECDEADRHFLDILYILAQQKEVKITVLENVTLLYIERRGVNYHLDPSSIAFLITFHFQAGTKIDAVKWLDYHSRRPMEDRTRFRATFVYPYSSFVHASLQASPEKDPRDIYSPILERMAKDYAWPDSAFMNILITAELQHSHFGRSLLLYDALRAHLARGVYPDETTYSQLFAAVANLVEEGGKSVHSELSISPRVLFREMVELQVLILAGHITAQTPVVTEVSLSAALRQFVISEDYAAAIIALQIFRSFHIPVKQPVLDDIIKVIFSRCRRELDSDRTKTWASAFLQVQGMPRSRIRHLSNWDLRRQIISVARRAHVLLKRHVLEVLDEKLRAGEQAEPTMQSNEMTTEQALSSDSESVVGVAEEDIPEQKRKSNSDENAASDSETSNEGDGDEMGTSEGPADLSFREGKKLTRGSRRRALIDALLYRALEIDTFIDGSPNPKELADKEIFEAEAAMIPDADKVVQGYVDESRLKQIIPDP